MTEDTINVALLVFVLIAVTMAIALFHVHKSDWINGRWKRQVGLGVLGAATFVVVLPNYCLHRCGNGQPLTHIIVAQICVPPVFLFVRQGRTRMLVAAAVGFIAWLPCNHFNKLVHSGRFIGTTELGHVHIRQAVPVTAQTLWHSRWTNLYRLETRKIEQPNKAADPTSEPASGASFSTEKQ